MPQTIDTFIAKWTASGAAERANKDAFLIELCDVLDVPRPDATTGDPAKDKYVFEMDAKLPREDGTVSIGKIDLYKAGCFILEAKQGSAHGAKKVGTAKRETPAWNVAMRDAYGQAIGYARSFDKPAPFIVACDIGYCFDLYASFDGSGVYRAFPNAQAQRIFFRDLPKHRDTLRGVFLDPLSLDPAKQAAKVTRDVATYIANLAKKLEADGHPQELIATFLMRCLFTMFAEDVGLLPQGAFTKALRDTWIPNPSSFEGGVESLWKTMNEGGPLYGVVGKILRFNGGLFASPKALPLGEHALRLLLVAADCNWAEVEPAIFGTLLERALDPKERHRLGAHYTPKAYVERLVRPTIEEPLRAEWDVVQAQVRKLVLDAAGVSEHGGLSEEEYLELGRAGTKKRKASKAAFTGARTNKLNQAKALLHEYHRKLTSLRVLDPACGSGNFLYVTLDLFKRIETEVLAALEALGAKQELLRADAIRVTPAQFLGIEVKRWAKEIAELVLWIGYLQWHFRMYGTTMPVPEPVLQDYKNIECRDAVLAYDDVEPLRDDKGKPVSRWDGETMKRSPVTGQEIPDETARVPVYGYVNPRKAEWPKADFIVGNPPFIGGWKLRQALGEGYVEALRCAHDDVPDACDFVMYWWNQGAKLVQKGAVQRAGLVMTTTISQVQGRRLTQPFLTDQGGLSLAFAVGDHPWATDRFGNAGDSAEVRVAMTTVVAGRTRGAVASVLREYMNDKDELVVETKLHYGTINADLRIGANVSAAMPLRASQDISSPGVKLHGAGFIVMPDQARTLGLGTVHGVDRHIRAYRNGKDITSTPRGAMVIDLFGLSEVDVASRFPVIYQWLLERVKPERDMNNRESYRQNWWLFGEPRAQFRPALLGLARYIVTPETARRRYFVFLSHEVLADNAVVAIALDDSFHLGVLSSRAHTVWALAAGGGLGVRHEPRYNKTRCFDPFPFPDSTGQHTSRVREGADRLDVHRRKQQGAHAALTLNGMYAVLEKLRSGEPLADKDKVIHEQGLVSVLKRLHDDLDAAVFDAYGWPRDLTDEQILEKLVALNAERAEEEKRGIVRWLRPDFQNPQQPKPMAQTELVTAQGDGEEIETATATGASPWPKKLAEQIGAVRDLVTNVPAEWSAAQVAAAFKGAKPTDAEDVLDGLAALGLIVAFKVPEGRRWMSSRVAS